MCSEKDYREKRTGKRLFTSIFCLLLLSGMIISFRYMFEKDNRSNLVKKSEEEEDIYPLAKGAENDCEQIWQICSKILGEENADTWEHYTWYMINEDTDKRMEEGVVLYRTKAGEQGFFLIREGALYRIKAADGIDRSDMYVIKKQIERLDQEEKTGNNQWEMTLWEIWDGRLPNDGLCWEDERVKEAVYKEICRDYSIVPSREEIMNLSVLNITSAERIETFNDLRKLPHLTSLTLTSLKEMNYDITGDMVPKLEELFFRWIPLDSADFLEELPDLKVLGMDSCNIKDLSFLQKYPHLTEVSFFGNEICDILPLQNCKNLEVISLSWNNITDISALSQLQKLKKVELLGNQIKDIDALREMKELEYLELSGNLIEDYTPIMDMENLYYLSVKGNPGQDIGNLIFTPQLGIGSEKEVEKEELERMQAYLNLYYPEDEILAEDFAIGDLNGDGIEDIAITGLVDVKEESETWPLEERYVYPFICKGNGSFIPLAPLESLGPAMGGPYGDPYCGMIITDHMLVIQVHGGSSSRWGYTNIYQYKEGEMKEKWEVELFYNTMSSGMDFIIYDKEKDYFKHYIVVGEMDEHKEILLISENNGESNIRKEELDVLLNQFKERVQTSFPEIREDYMAPHIDGTCDYHICSYPVIREPNWVLKQVAGKLLEEATSMPATYYTSEEIRESYGKLIGVEPPKVFYIGLMEGEPVILYYNNCIQEGDRFVHEMILCKPDEKGEYWRLIYWINYDENTDTYTLRDNNYNF